MRRFLLYLLLSAIASLANAQNKFYVKQNGTGDGLSWASAAGDLQAAINGAAAGDSVFVAGGTYQPGSGQSFYMKQGVKIYGSFAGSEPSLTDRSLASADTSVLQGNGMSVIDNQVSLDPSSVLDGFKITGGYANTNINGGHGGGGIYNLNASPTLSHLVIIGNGCNYYGGGIGCVNGSPILDHVVIKGNAASTGGGGLYCDNSSLVLRNVLISENSGYVGGGLWCAQGSIIFTNVTITNNTAIQGGGLASGADLTVNNSIIWGNNASGNANELSFLPFFFITVTMHHSLFRDGPQNIGDGAPFSSIVATDNNLTVSPQFVDLAGGNYLLQPSSPAIDAGTPDTTGLYIGNTDLAGNARIMGAFIDIGAYEFNSSTLPVDLVIFDGNLKNGTASLKWESGVETNLNRYVIETGADGKTFMPIGSVSAKGSITHYSYSLPQRELTVYYRLNMVDNNGKSRYSDVVCLTRKTNENVSDEGDKISIYPNPASHYIHLNTTVAGKIYLYNVSGKLLKTEKVQAGLNKIDIRALSAGIYFIRSERFDMKFIKR